jgi:hypothetical protein
MEDAAMPTAARQALDLFQPRRRPPRPDMGRGYLDLLDEDDSTSPSIGQRLMETRFLPRIYQRL